MKQLWSKYAGKIDALLPRERAMVFVAVVAVVLFMMNALFIDPPATRNKALSKQMAQQQTELQILQLKIQALEKKRADPDAANLARRDGIKREIAAISATLKAMQQGLVPAQNMKTLLQDVLARNPRLQLIAMRTLPVTALVEKRSEKLAASESTVFKHGVQITIQGGYADLHDYLARLEKLPWRMFWSRASLSADDYRRLTLTVTIYTLSLDKAWLVV